MTFVLFSDSLIDTTYNVQNNMFGSLHTTDLLHEKSLQTLRFSLDKTTFRESIIPFLFGQ